MPVPDPKVVRTLLTAYASLRIAQAERRTPQTARELAEVSRRLCATMGTPDLGEAIARADAVLCSARRTTAPDRRGDGSLSTAA